MTQLPGGDYTCENAIPAGFTGRVEVYFGATWGKTPGLSRISNIVSLNVFG